MKLSRPHVSHSSIYLLLVPEMFRPGPVRGLYIASWLCWGWFARFYVDQDAQVGKRGLIFVESKPHFRFAQHGFFAMLVLLLSLYFVLFLL